MLRGQVLHWRTSSQNLTPFPHAVEVMTAKRGQSELTRLYRTLLNVDNTLGGVRWPRKGTGSIPIGSGSDTTGKTSGSDPS